MRIIILLPIVFLLACNNKLQVTTNEPLGTTFLESPGSGLVTLRSTGEGSNFKKAEKDAIIRAFETVILRGMPRFTALSRPMVASESEFRAKAPEFFNGLVQEGTYERFITEQWDPVEIAAQRGKRISKDMTINYQNLRKYLEEIGATRKFGY